MKLVSQDLPFLNPYWLGLVVLHMLCGCTQDYLFHKLPWHQGQADRSGVLRITGVTIKNKYKKHIENLSLILNSHVPYHIQ